MKSTNKGTNQNKSSNITNPIPAKSAIDLPPYEEMVNQLLKNGAMTKEDIQALDYRDGFD